MDSALQISDFGDAIREIFGYQPFLWQQEILQDVAESNRWPDLIDMPTGTGKTSVIDIALFHIALATATGAKVARRVAFVVDRRVVVDAAHDRAQKIANFLQQAINQDSASGRWARALASLSGGVPVQAVRMRGGMPLERIPVRDPRQTVLLSATVDQIGSRILFRGYGCSPFSWPIHAGLLGIDTLVFLDEAHLSEPFRQTIDRISLLQNRASEGAGLPPPVSCVRLSATAGRRKNETAFPSDNESKNRYLGEPSIKVRIEASKPVWIRQCSTKKLAQPIAAEASAMLLALRDEYAAPAIGVVVNRIATAREIFDRLARSLKVEEVDLILLIGRNRPLDRQRLTEKYSARLASGRHPTENDRPIMVVATQTIEVGADFDFQGMVTEVASWDALRQRFGRLNRLGGFRRAYGAIVGSDLPAEDDPIYGAALKNTWDFLRAQANEDGFVSFSLQDLTKIGEEPVPGMARLLPNAGFLSVPLMELFVQTSPQSRPCPEVENFLHGFDRGEPEVNLVFRAGIPLKSVAGGAIRTIDRSSGARHKLNAVLEMLPPTSLESLTLASSSATRLLSYRFSRSGLKPEISDLEGTIRVPTATDTNEKEIVWIWNGKELTDKRISELQAGDTVLVPCEWGGCDEFGVAPEGAQATWDQAETALQFGASHKPFSQARAQRLVLDPTRFTHVEWLRKATKSQREGVAAIAQRHLTCLVKNETDAKTAAQDILESIGGFLPEYWRSDSNPRIKLLENEDGIPFALAVTESKPRGGDLSDEDLSSSRSVPVPLVDHSAGVAAVAWEFSSHSLIDRSLQRLLERAGFAHDFGKAEPRFQAMLHASSPGADPDLALAKSARVGGRRVELGERHEAYSVSLLRQNPELFGDHDPDLLSYLVGTHHGRGRPLMPDRPDVGMDFELAVGDAKAFHSGAPNLGAVGSGWPDLFWRLVERYGPWGLAYLEALLRLADHRRSELELEASDD